MSKIRLYLESIAIPLGLGILVSLVLKDSFNYDSLIKPNFAPPAILFPIVWTILYTLMGVSYARIKGKGINHDEVRKIYYSQLFVNLVWPILFLDWKQEVLH